MRDRRHQGWNDLVIAHDSIRLAAPPVIARHADVPGDRVIAETHGPRNGRMANGTDRLFDGHLHRRGHGGGRVREVCGRRGPEYAARQRRCLGILAFPLAASAIVDRIGMTVALSAGTVAPVGATGNVARTGLVEPPPSSGNRRRRYSPVASNSDWSRKNMRQRAEGAIRLGVGPPCPTCRSSKTGVVLAHRGGATDRVCAECAHAWTTPPPIRRRTRSGETIH